MRDTDAPPDEDLLDVQPDDPEERDRYVRSFRALYGTELDDANDPGLEPRVVQVLRLCGELNVRHPHDVLRLLRLMLVVVPSVRRSELLDRVVHRILTATEHWSATKRLDFIDAHVIGRDLPVDEPYLGPWWQGRASNWLVDDLE